MKRRFITLLGSAAAAWPLARAQGERVRRIGVLVYLAADDAEGQARLAAFAQALQQLGWSEGVTCGSTPAGPRPATLVDTRRNWPRSRRTSSWLPPGTAAAAALLQATRTVPIVFVIAIDPVGAGFVASLAKPGGNATGFTVYEYSMVENGWNCSKRSRPA